MNDYSGEKLCQGLDYSKTPQYAAATPWRREYFDIVTDAITSDESPLLKRIGIYNTSSGPVMVLAYGSN